MDKRVLIVNTKGEIQDQPKLLSANERTFEETFLQKLIFDRPELLPIDAIDSNNAKLIPINREVAISSGSIDALYLTTNGNICVVETKLWRNPESHRTVLAQVIEYARALSELSFDEFCQVAMKEKTNLARTAFLEKVKPFFTDFSNEELESKIQEALASGRFKLLIVGDKIYPEVVLLKDAISSAPHLEFNIQLVELHFYRLESTKDSLLVIPQIIGKSVEQVRAVVKIRYEKKPDVDVTSIDSEDSKTGKTSKREFLSSMPSDFADRLLLYLDDWEKKYIVYWGVLGFSVRVPFKGKLKTLFEIYPTDLSILSNKRFKSARLPDEASNICKTFQNSVSGIPAVNRVILKDGVYVNFKDLSVDEFSKLLSENDKMAADFADLGREKQNS